MERNRHFTLSPLGRILEHTDYPVEIGKYNIVTQGNCSTRQIPQELLTRKGTVRLTDGPWPERTETYALSERLPSAETRACDI